VKLVFQPDRAPEAKAYLAVGPAVGWAGPGSPINAPSRPGTAPPPAPRPGSRLRAQGRRSR
jgi:hypothetical protein